MPRVEMVIGYDIDGDASVLFQIFGEDGEHLRYANEVEVQRYLTKLAEADAEPQPEDLGVCLACGAECDEEGTCENCEEDDDA